MQVEYNKLCLHKRHKNVPYNFFPFHKHSRQSHLTINKLYYKYKKDMCTFQKKKSKRTKEMISKKNAWE